MIPVVGFERDRAVQRSVRISSLADAPEHEPQRGERFAIVGLQRARFVCVRLRQAQCLDIRCGVGARRFERERAGRGHADVHPGFAGVVQQQLFEGAAGLGDARERQRFERGPSFGERPMRRQQLLELTGQQPHVDRLHGANERVAVTTRGVDAAGTLIDVDDPAEPEHHLGEAAVGGDLSRPPDLNQLIFGEDLTAMRDQPFEDIQLPPRHQHQRAVEQQPAAARVELKGSEREAAACRHGGDCK